jgi:hypothetical protein
MNNALPKLTEYQLTDLPGLGWIVINHIGEENLYFTLADGSEGFIKCL